MSAVETPPADPQNLAISLNKDRGQRMHEVVHSAIFPQVGHFRLLILTGGPNWLDNVLMSTSPTDLLTENLQSPAFGQAHLPANAILLFCRRLIEEGFERACECKDGRPTEAALEALLWLLVPADWTLYRRAQRAGRPPDPDARREFCGTFEWACRWLEEDPATVRRFGLRPAWSRFGKPLVAQRGAEFIAGLGAIYESWAHAEARAAAKRQRSVA